MHKRTKALAISKAVKARVWERDGQECMICGSRQARPEAHFISRAHSGLGIEENILTLCRRCHDVFDNGSREQREEMREVFRSHLRRHYPGWDEQNLIYRKLNYVK